MSYFYDQDTNKPKAFKIFIAISLLIIILIAVLMASIPIYRVWSRGLSGKAQLREAEWNRQIATLDAQAEIERAKGVAEANQIIAKGLKGNEEYLRYLWIQTLNDQSVIYVPTEANLPILEARDER